MSKFTVNLELATVVTWLQISFNIWCVFKFAVPINRTHAAVLTVPSRGQNVHVKSNICQ